MKNLFLIDSFTLSSTTSSTTPTISTTTTSNNDDNQTPKPRKWQPKIPTLSERRHLRNQKHQTEKINTLRFHHIEFYCGDSKMTSMRFALALGMDIMCHSDQSTGNDVCVSYGVRSGEVRFLFTAPYSTACCCSSSSSDNNKEVYDAPDPLPGYDNQFSHEFYRRHGLAVRAVAVEVVDARESYENAVENGAVGVLEPTMMEPCGGYKNAVKEYNDDVKGCQMAEVKLYGDVVLRFISFDDEEKQRIVSSEKTLPFLPNMSPLDPDHPLSSSEGHRRSFGIEKIDHAVGNVPDLYDVATYIQRFTGFHEFAEFTSEDVGTVDSGLNSVVLASDSEHVLLPLNEPTNGRRKSQIQTYLEQNEGSGLQHLALKTNDIFATVEHMRSALSNLYGFDLMKRPSDGYYKELPDRLGDRLTTEQYERLEQLGILADADDEGTLLQIFTKPIGDRPTFFIEIIQRVGCTYKEQDANDEMEQTVKERPGCGGFGQGNFKELFKSIEDHEKTLKV